MNMYSLIDFNQQVLKKKKQVLIGRNCMPITVYSSDKDSGDIGQRFSQLTYIRITWRAHPVGLGCGPKFSISNKGQDNVGTGGEELCLSVPPPKGQR